MSCSTGIGLIAWIVLLTITVRGQVPGPNAVALINGQTMLDCTTIDLALSNWRHTPDGISASVLIASGCIISAGNFAAYYRTEPGINTCRLIIANVTMQQAGVYTCYNGVSTTNQSLVTVIDPVASIVVYNRSEVVDGDLLNISCSINYNGPQLPAPSQHPLPYWTTSSPGQIFINATYQLSTNVSTVIATVTVQKYTVPIFQCYTVFEIKGSTSGYNPTPPSDSFAVGSTKEIVVQYPVENIITNSTVPHPENCISRPETLTCTAKANPPAQYKWHDLKNNITTSGPDKSISTDGEFQCIASNSIRNQPYNETKNEIVTSCLPTQNLTINGTNCVDNVCTCKGNDSDSKQISITCMANGIPIPSVEWRSHNLFDGLYETIGVTLDGNYSCVASNKYGGNEYSQERTVFVSDCTVSSSSLLWLLFLIYPGLGWIFGCLFLIYYFKKKSACNKHFSFLKKMLPCMNTEVSATTFEQCGWIILYILMVTTVGVFVIPFMVIKVQFFSSASTAVDINNVELSGTAHPENNAPPPKETTVHEKNNDENVVKKTKKKKKKKVTA